MGSEQQVWKIWAPNKDTVREIQKYKFRKDVSRKSGLQRHVTFSSFLHLRKESNIYETKKKVESQILLAVDN